VDVFVLYFLGPDADGHWFGKFLGVYSTQARAARAVERLQGLPGYRYYPRGFQVECVRLDGEPDLSELGVPPPHPLPPPECVVARRPAEVE
jgi:hypothetical protein